MSNFIFVLAVAVLFAIVYYVGIKPAKDKEAAKHPPVGGSGGGSGDGGFGTDPRNEEPK